jgi:PAS domain S-box-containing protein
MITILLVEDDLVDQMAFKAEVATRKLPYDFQIASSIAEARRHLAAARFDVIIADYKLQDGTAFDLADVFGSQLVIFATGAGDEETAAQAMRRGVHDYIIKDPDRKYLRLLSHRIDHALRAWRAERQIRESEEKFRAIYELSPLGIALIDSQSGRFHQLNPTCCEIIGRTEEEMRCLAVADITHPEDSPVELEHLARLKEGAIRSFTMEKRLIRSGGSQIWANVTVVPMWRAGETPRCHIAMIEDITARKHAENALRQLNAELEARVAMRTKELSDANRKLEGDISERKRAEASLRESETRYRALVETSGDAIFLLDLSGRIRAANPAAAAMHGYPQDELLGMRMQDLDSPDGAAKIPQRIQRMREGEVLTFEVNHRRKDGSMFPVEVIASALEIGGEWFVLGFDRDITDRKQAAAEIERSLKTLQLFIDTVPAYISFVDKDERYQLVNRAYEEYFRRPASKIVGKRVCDVQPPDAYEEMLPHVRAALAGKSVRYVSNPPSPDGKSYWFDVQYVPRKSEDGSVSGFFVMVFDITESKQAQIERENLDRKLQEAQKLESLGVLAGGIAHDFNNLLTSILGNASIAAMDLPPGSPIHDSISPINEAALRAADLCKQMLAYSGRGRFVVQKMDLGQLVEQTTQMLQISISKKAVMRFRLEKDLPQIEVDATQIRQVIMNLVINASEAIGDKSGVISISTGLTRVDRAYLAGTLVDPDIPEGDYVFLEITDTGCGMSRETQAKIFDPFFTTKFTGRGLGLAAVIGIVRGHKGALKVYSELGRGTTFKLLFPAADSVGKAESAATGTAGDWRSTGTVLVVDDEETMRSTVARMLRKHGIDPVLVADGRQAVEVFRAQPGRFALVLLDLTMPHMDGEQTFAELRRLHSDVRVVLMSGFDAHEATVRFTGKGLASFLQKPFTIESLRAVLQKVMD